MSRYPILDPTTLGRLTLVDVPDEEAVIRARMLRFKSLWAESDPPLGALYDVEGTEFDPIKINQEVNASFEVNLIARLNAFGEATSLSHGWGTNLEVIASRYPGGVPKQAGEGDERYRRRIWLSSNAFSTAGAEKAYEFWAMTAQPVLRDVSVTVSRPTLNDVPTLVITGLREGPTGIPTTAELLTVHTFLHEPDIKPRTDVVTVVAPVVIDLTYDLDVWLYPFADKDATLATMRTALEKLADDTFFLGEDQTRFAIAAAAKTVGVQNIVIKSPVADMPMSPRQVGRVPYTVNVDGSRNYSASILLNYRGRAA